MHIFITEINATPEMGKSTWLRSKIRHERSQAFDPPLNTVLKYILQEEYFIAHSQFNHRMFLFYHYLWNKNRAQILF